MLDPRRTDAGAPHAEGSPLPRRVPTVVTLQYLRGLAASLIVFHHAMSPPAVAPYYPHHFAECGVDLFFVISGYIMWTTTAGSGRGPNRFWRARIARVVPLYWTFTTLFILAMLMVPGALFNAPPLDPLFVLKSYLFVPTAGGPVYSLGWTLNYEMFFYLIFGICLLIRPARLRLATLTAAFVALVAIGLIQRPANIVAASYTNPLLLEFLIGVYLAVLTPSIQRLPKWAACAAIALGVGAIAYDAWTGVMLDRVIVYGLPAALITAGVLSFEPLAAARPNKVLLFLGDASYSIYLAHPFGERIWYSAVHLLAPALSGVLLLVYILGAIAAGLLAGALSYLLIERPLLAAGRRLLGIASSRRRTLAPA